MGKLLKNAMRKKSKNKFNLIIIIIYDSSFNTINKNLLK